LARSTSGIQSAEMIVKARDDDNDDYDSNSQMSSSSGMQLNI